MPMQQESKGRENDMNSIQDIWDSIMQILKQELTTTSINTWFGECAPVDLENGSLVIQTSSTFKRDIIRQRYGSIIKEALHDLFSCDYELTVLTSDEVDDYFKRKRDEKSLPEMDGYTFDNFIVGPSNKFAHAAALGVVKNPGSRAYNPLFIYGNSGLGKTHLLLAIGSAIHENDPEAKIIYIKGDEFLNEMVHSLREGQAEEFRRKYRNVDLFLVDDIQFIAGKESTQEEFFHTFNNIYESGHQIVLTSDRPPMAIARLDDRLRTRFEGGLMADVQPPDTETRMAIIRDKAGHLGMALSDENVQYIAEKLTSNIRQLEGVVKRLSAYKEITEGPITRAIIDEAIRTVIQNGIYIPTPDSILAEVARYYQVSEEEVKGQSRQKTIANARHVTAYLIRILTNLPLNAIGEFLNRDHATIAFSVTKIEESMKNNTDLAGTIRDITSNINSRPREG